MSVRPTRRWRARARAGATKFNKKEKKAFEERRVTTLGGHAEKNEKMPFKMLLAVRAANKARDAKRAEQARRARARALARGRELAA